jgi:MFS family permease
VLASGWSWVLLVRFLERVGKGVRVAPRDALVADSIKPEKRGLAFGLHRAGDTAGAALGLIIALLVVWRLQGHELSLARTTFHTLVWLSVIPAVAAVAALIIGIREPATKCHRPRATGKLEALPPAFRSYLAAVVLFTLGNSSAAFLTLRAQEQGVTLLGIMGMLVMYNLVYALVSSPAGALSDRLGRRKMLIAGWLLYAAIYLGMALAQSAFHVIALMGCYGFYKGVAGGAAKSYVADLVSEHQRGTAFGWYSGAVGLAALPASLIAGLLWQGIGEWSGFGVPAPFLFGSAMALAGVALLRRTPVVEDQVAAAG